MLNGDTIKLKYNQIKKCQCENNPSSFNENKIDNTVVKEKDKKKLVNRSIWDYYHPCKEGKSFTRFLLRHVNLDCTYCKKEYQTQGIFSCK